LTTIGPNSGEQGYGFVTNELNIESIKNRLLPAVKEDTRKSGKDYDSKKYYSFLLHMMRISKRHFNQLDFGKVLC
jgi:hypothetical protein